MDIDFEALPHQYIIIQDSTIQAEVQTIEEAESFSSTLKNACPNCDVRYTGPGNYQITFVVNDPPPPPPPPSGNIPAWYSNMQDYQWIDMETVGAKTFAEVDPLLLFPNWDFGFSLSGGDHHTSVIEGWNGGAAREDYLVLGLSGGHRGGAQNTVFEFGPFSSDNPDWHWYGTDPSKYDTPSHSPGTISNWSAQINEPYYSDGRPTATHTYDRLVFVPDLGNGKGNILLRQFGTFMWSGNEGGSGRTAKAASFKFNLGDVGGFYEAENTYPDFPARLSSGGLSEYDPATQLVWSFSTIGGASSGPKRAVYSFDVRTESYQFYGSVPAGSWTSDTDGGSLDPVRRVLVNNTDTGLIVIDISQGREGESVFISNYSGAIARNRKIGMEYEPIGQKFVGYDGGNSIYVMEPPSNYRNADGSLNSSASWQWVAVNVSGATVSPAQSTGTFGRFRYIPSIGAFAVINQVDDSVFVFKVPSTGL